MKTLLQPAGILGKLSHFEQSIEEGISVDFFKDKIDRVSYEKLLNLNVENIKVWGMEPLEKEPTRKAWKDIEEDDWVLFYNNHRFIYQGKIFFKIHDHSLASQIWGSREDGASWDFIYFIKEARQIEVSYKPTLIGYKSNHVIQRAYVLNEQNSKILIDYINEGQGDFIDENQVDPTSEDIKKVNTRSLSLRSHDDILKAISDLSVEAESKPVKERIRLAKALSRNNKFSQLVKERVQYICEICGTKPFIQKNGMPYAEAHHIDELAKSRIDSPSRMICVCPVCHRVLHFGNEEALKMRKSLLEKSSR